VFGENDHFILAYGDGLEQLTPTVADYNGDGTPDPLVAERSGKRRIPEYGRTGEIRRCSARSCSPRSFPARGSPLNFEEFRPFPRRFELRWAF
jgi:hypothetical protein